MVKRYELSDAGAKDQAVRRSREGLTTEISVLLDALGRPLRFILTKRTTALCR